LIHLPTPFLATRSLACFPITLQLLRSAATTGRGRSITRTLSFVKPNRPVDGGMPPLQATKGPADVFPSLLAAESVAFDCRVVVKVLNSRPALYTRSTHLSRNDGSMDHRHRLPDNCRLYGIFPICQALP